MRRLTATPETLGQVRQLQIVLSAVALTLVIGWMDILIGPVASLWVLYLVPIALVSWLVGSRAALLVAVLSAAVGLFSQLDGIPAGTAMLVTAWNALSVMAVFGLTAVGIAHLHRLLLEQTRLARQDFLTHVPNRMSFSEQLPGELRSAAGRHAPVTLGLVDVHGIAYVNERFGMRAGDHLLLNTAAALRANLTDGDLIGRVGGTTFAIVLPGRGEEDARRVLEAVREQLLRKINLYDRPISIAIAAVSTDQPAGEGDNLLDRTGWLLQTIKQDRTLHPFRVVGAHEVRA